MGLVHWPIESTLLSQFAGFVLNPLCFKSGKKLELRAFNVHLDFSMTVVALFSASTT